MYGFVLAFDAADEPPVPTAVKMPCLANKENLQQKVEFRVKNYGWRETNLPNILTDVRFRRLMVLC
jgi:hypothetical protein